MPISERVKKGLQRGSFLRRISEERIALKKKYGSENVFDLSEDYPALESSAVFDIELQKLIEVPRPGLHRYMENAGYTDTRAVIAERLALETGLKFTLNEVIMTSGATGAINMAFKALLNPGEQVILLAPLFYDYEAFVENHAGVCKVLPPGENFMPDFAALEAAITPETKAVLVNSPNNPAGSVYSDDVLKQIADIISRKSARLKTRIYIVSDDSYRQFYYGGERCPWILNHYPHTIIISSYSKDFSVPGERIGYTAVSPECEDAKAVVGGLIHANRTLGFVNAPALMQNVVRGLPACSIDVAAYQRKRDFLYNSLSRMGYPAVLPQGAFYLFPPVPIEDDFTFVSELMKQRVITLPGSLFHSPGHIRISYCVDDRTLEGSLTGFQKTFEKYRK